MRPTGPRDLYAGLEEGPEPPFPIQLRGPVIKGFGRGSRELGIPTANIPPSGLAAYPDLQSGVYFGFVGLRLDAATTQPADNSKLTLSASATTNTPTPSADTAPSASAPNTTSSHPSTTSNAEIPTQPTTQIYPSVLSIGYNPFYANKTRSIEIHVLHHFRQYNFYHAPLNLLVMGFIRPEYDYESLEALVSDIRVDCEVAGRSLRREGYVGMIQGEEGEENEKREGEGEAKEEGKGKGGWGKWLRDFEWVEDIDVEGEERGVLGGDGGKGEGKAEGEKEKL